MKRLGLFFIISLFLINLFKNHAFAQEELILRDSLQRAQPGDYLVIAQNKAYTLLLIRSQESNKIDVEEISIPSQQIPEQGFSWRQWFEKGAPGNTCRIIYSILVPSGSIQNAFSVTKNEWISIPQSQSFLSTLLNLKLKMIPLAERKKVGPRPHADSIDRRPLWQPPFVSDGKKISGVEFNGWRTRWPKDGSDLSDKVIEVYTPKDSSKYPTYFPYWLQVSGIVGKAKVRIVDSGSRLAVPTHLNGHMD